MEPSPYLIRLSRIARWRLPPKEAADVISDYSEIMAIDPRLYEDQCKDYGTPKQAVKQLTTFADYGRWMAVFLVLAACLAAPAAWLLLQFPHFQFELPREALFLPLLLRDLRYFWKTVLLGFEFSLLVEIMQLFGKVGSFDVDDILLNTLGTACGYVSFLILFALRRKRGATHEKKGEKR